MILVQLSKNLLKIIKKIALLSGLAFLLIIIALSGAFVAIVAATLGFAEFSGKMTQFNPLDFSVVGILIYILILVLFSGLVSPIGAGFLKIAYLAHANKEFSIGTVFDYYKTAHFKELFISASLLTIVNLGFTLVLEFLEVPILGTVISYVIAYFTLLTVPLIVFANQSAMDAISNSSKLVMKQPIIILGLVIVAFISVLLGLFGLCIGIFFTFPFWYSTIFTIYNSIIPTEETTEIEEIGSYQE